MATLQQRFEVDRPTSAVYEAISHPLEVLESFPAVTGVRLVSADVYRVSVGPVDRSREVELHITSRIPLQSVAWRSADGQYSGTITLEPAGADRTAVSVQADSAGSAETESPPASAMHDALQALKRALQSPQVRISHGSGDAHERSLGAGFRRFASELRGSRAALAHPTEYPFHLMRTFSRQVDRVFGELWRGTPVAHLANLVPGLPWNPKVEVCEQNEQVRICVDVPGVDESQLNVEVDEGCLTVRGERHDERAQEPGHRRSELYYGNFTRRVPLPDGIDKAGARAVLRNGVLEIRIPLHRSQPRRVPVEHAT